jgi:hypothetical protein
VLMLGVTLVSYLLFGVLVGGHLFQLLVIWYRNLCMRNCFFLAVFTSVLILCFHEVLLYVHFSRQFVVNLFTL